MTTGPAPLLPLSIAAALAFASDSWGQPASTESQQASAAVAAEMMIGAGRLGVMLDQAQAAMQLRAGEPSEEGVETPAQQQLYVVHELRAAVFRYNTMQFEACRAAVVSGEVCAQPYTPEWLKEGIDIVPPAVALAARVQDAVAHIMPFWKAMCAKAIARTHDDTFCAIE